MWRVSVRRMVVKLNRPDIRYEVESLTRMLLGEAPVTVVLPGETPPRDDDHITVTVSEQPDGCLCRVVTHFDGKTAEGTQSTTPDRTDCEQTVCRLIYDQLTMLLGHTLPWGMLTGVRPVKLVRQMAETGMTEALIEQKLLDYGVSPERVRLSLETWQNQRDIISALSPEKISLYVSIPFCPSRCSYCSFVSHSIERAADMLEQYLPLLLRELRLTARLIKEAGLSVVSVYIGGGTPTTLSAPQMELLLQEICKDFDLSACGEFTVEAGRPDTITREKLMVLAKNGVNRISINPQTMKQATLDLIGRRHTVEDVKEKFLLARTRRLAPQHLINIGVVFACHCLTSPAPLLERALKAQHLRLCLAGVLVARLTEHHPRRLEPQLRLHGRVGCHLGQLLEDARLFALKVHHVLRSRYEST